MANTPVVETIFDAVLSNLRSEAAGSDARYWLLTSATVYEGTPDEAKLGKAEFPCLFVDRAFSENLDDSPMHPSARKLDIIIQLAGYVKTTNNRRDVVRFEHDVWEAWRQIGSIAGCSSAGQMTDLDLADQEIGIAKRETAGAQPRVLVSVFNAEITYKAAETAAA